MEEARMMAICVWLCIGGAAVVLLIAWLMI